MLVGPIFFPASDGLGVEAQALKKAMSNEQEKAMSNEGKESEE